MLKSSIIFILRKMNIYGLYKLRRHSFLSDVGWFKSFHLEQSIDDNHAPLPWMNYACLYFLKARIKKNMTVFEYGCGNSTLWWAAYASRVVSCEHDIDWYQKVIKIKPDNVEIFQVDLQYGGAYCQKITAYKSTFDIVVIDGRDRINCAKNALGALKKGGVILWDNADREEYQPGIAFLSQHNYKKIDFYGIAPMTIEGCVTSIFYQSDNCLNI
jgi:hypothetical protein